MSTKELVDESQDVIQSYLKTDICIRPYTIGNKENMGLEKYNMVVFDGIVHEEQMACVETNGVVRYLNGLNEFAPEIKFISDPVKKAAKIKEIRTIVSYIEKEMASNVIDIEDPEFWNKVKICKPSNHEFWGGIKIRCGNVPTYLNPKNKIEDLIKIVSIEAGGFSIVAKSLQDAKSANKPPKFYLDRNIDTISTVTQDKKIKNKALAKLDELFNEDPNKLWYVAKNTDSYSLTYLKKTSNDQVYENMDNYINGLGAEKAIKKAAKIFLENCDKDLQYLIIKAIVKDGLLLKFLSTKPDGMIHHVSLNQICGKNLEECVEHFNNPAHEEALITLKNDVEKFWNG
jgi:hypothetical protein